MELPQEIKNVSKIEINLTDHPKISIHAICDDCGRNYELNTKGVSGISLKRPKSTNGYKFSHVPSPTPPYFDSVTSEQQIRNSPSKVKRLAKKWEQQSNGNFMRNRGGVRSTGELRNSKTDTYVEFCKPCQTRTISNPLFSTVSSSLKWKRNNFKNYPLWISKLIHVTKSSSLTKLEFQGNNDFTNYCDNPNLCQKQILKDKTNIQNNYNNYSESSSIFTKTESGTFKPLCCYNCSKKVNPIRDKTESEISESDDENEIEIQSYSNSTPESPNGPYRPGYLKNHSQKFESLKQKFNNGKIENDKSNSKIPRSNDAFIKSDTDYSDNFKCISQRPNMFQNNGLQVSGSVTNGNKSLTSNSFSTISKEVSDTDGSNTINKISCQEKEKTGCDKDCSNKEKNNKSESPDENKGTSNINSEFYRHQMSYLRTHEQKTDDLNTSDPEYRIRSYFLTGNK